MNREEYTPIFAGQDYETILARMLNKVSDEFDKREGSIIFDAHAPAAIELAIIYSYLDFVLKNSFGNTANRFWLIQRAKERGIEPYPATNAIVIGKFNQDVGLDRLFHADGIYFKTVKFVEERGGLFYYELRAEKAGEVGNLKAGKLTPSETVRGLTVSEIVKVAILGQEEEDTEHFRNRYYETIKTNAYGGNIDDYRRKVAAIDGVGQVKVIPVWNGGGTVKIIITDSKNGFPTEELVAKVQEAIDPVPYHQKGVGVAPIGHLVTVIGAKKKDISLSLKLMINRDKAEVESQIRKTIGEYFQSQRFAWGEFVKDNSKIYVENDIRLTKLMSLILAVPGVVDYEEISFKDSKDKILVLAEEEIPYVGDISIVEVVVS